MKITITIEKLLIGIEHDAATPQTLDSYIEALDAAVKNMATQPPAPADNGKAPGTRKPGPLLGKDGDDV